MNLIENIKKIQRTIGVHDDGVFGPITARAVLGAVRGQSGVSYDADTEVDERSLKNIATLLERAQVAFKEFYRLANATAASMGCEYIAISGNRTWEQQQALYDQGRTKPGKKVTRAKPGSSWHNFGVALDFGVFRGRSYLDNVDAKLARRVHIACAKHAEECGLEWGGNWKNFKDIPHYQLKVDVSLAGARKIYREGRWV